MIVPVVTFLKLESPVLSVGTKRRSARFNINLRCKKLKEILLNF
jgi:hypothetical protein